MIIILYLSAALIAISFLILVIYLSKTFKSVQLTLDSVSKTLNGLEKQLDGVMSETTELLKKTNALADDINKKAENLNSVVYAVKDVGTSIKKFNHTIQTVTDTVDRSVEENQEKISQIVQWSNVLIELKDKWKNRKLQKQMEIKPSGTRQRQRNQ
ncbi:DUF948 domain-containing protein [Bacillus sp. 1NLA3E]|uniref:DUF948 domain-containing protein n=1 Tax=Bacillus sp. 1NLA3E TaxID=666686 RepID=UPI000247E5A5|nr:DUF948 domain-containing protein [Bacillus sp. 1NLA3E]AGK55234.1 general stress protein [Bacillus sp. 1NLA3E]